MEATTPVSRSFLETLPPTRRAILVAIKCQTSATVEDLTRLCRLPAEATRQPLNVMRAHGYVSRTRERAGVGRPRDRYWLTPLGELLFAGTSGALVDRFLDALKDEPAEVRSRLLARVMGEVGDKSAVRPGASAGERRDSAAVA